MIRYPDYPEAAESLKAFIQIVRAGEARARLAEFVQHGATVECYLLGILVGEASPKPVRPVFGAAGVADLSDEDALDHLDVVAAADPVAVPQGSPVRGALPIPWGPLLAWVVRKLLDAVLS